MQPQPDDLCLCLEVNLHLRNLEEIEGAIFPLLAPHWQAQVPAQANGDPPVMAALGSLGWTSRLAQPNPGVPPLLNLTGQIISTRLGNDARLFTALAPYVIQAEPPARVLFSLVADTEGPTKATYMAWTFENTLKLRRVTAHMNYVLEGIVDHEGLMSSAKHAAVKRYEVRLPGKIHHRLVEERYTPTATEVQDLGRGRESALYLMTRDEIDALAKRLADWGDPVLAERVKATLG